MQGIFTHENAFFQKFYLCKTICAYTTCAYRIVRTARHNI